MKSALKNVKKQVGGLAKHAGKQVARQPLEILKQAAGEKGRDSREDNRALEELEKASSQAKKSDDGQDDGFTGFQTREDYERYKDLAKRRDEILLRRERKKLQKEFGIDLDLESGMKKVRQERKKEKKEEEKVEEKEKKKEEFLQEKEKEESLNRQVEAAKRSTAPETRVGRKITG